MSLANQYTVHEISKMREAFHYDPDTGEFTHATNKYTGVGLKAVIAREGSPAGGYSRLGYLMVRVLGKKILASRVAWMIVHGAPIPEGMVIDHINGDTKDNRISNLRAVPSRTNSQNRRTPARTGTTGYLGVSLSAQSGRYKAQIREPGAQGPTVIGYFDCPQKAHEAYISAKRKYHEGNTL